MAVDSYGPKNEPQFAASGAPDDAADLTTVAAYAAKMGNSRVGTNAQRTALTGKDLYVGLTFYETDTDTLYVNKTTGWVSIIGDTGWLNPSFANSSNAGTGDDVAGQPNPPVQYRLRNGVVSMTGYWVPTVNSEIQFRLPAGYRPKYTSTFWCHRGSNNGPGARMEIQRGSGAVIYRVSPSGGTGAVDYSQIRFDADA